MRPAGFVLCIALTAGFPGAAAADLVAIDAARDNTLYEATSNFLSNGIGVGVFSGLTVAHELRRGLIAFDIAAAVPAGASITSAQLELNVSRALGGTHASSLHRVTADWGEGNSNSTERGGGMGAPAAPGDATWMHTFFDTQTWTTLGGDFVAQPSASVDISGTGPVVWGSTAQMVADVQMWLDAPQDNFGWILRTAENTPGSTKRFDSREHPNAAVRPVLLVEYQGTAVRPSTWSATKALFR